MILIYCPDLTPRKQYIFRHIFRRLLMQDYEVTAELNVFVGHDGIKFSYGTKPLGDEMFIWSQGLLDEHGIDDHEIEVMQWDELPAFFTAPERSDIPFDLFAASFFLITRYEEYLPQVKDDYGRYSPYESAAFKGGFLNQPLIDLWVKKFAVQLGLEVSTLSRKRDIDKLIAIEVSSFNKYNKRGIIINTAAFLRHVGKLQLGRAWTQIKTLFNVVQDPYDNSETILKLVRNYRSSRGRKPGRKLKMCFFFHLGDYNDLNTGVTYKSKSYVEAIKHIADYVQIGLRFSRNTVQEDVYREERRFEELLKRPLQYTMAANSKISMPGHYKLLVDTKTMEDYSMGYVTEPGYRASTGFPFYFYDLDYEVQTPLLIQPYSLHYESISLQSLNGQQQVLRAAVEGARSVGARLIVQFNYEHFDRDINGHAMEILEAIINE
jgi:hypothetical protein